MIPKYRAWHIEEKKIYMVSGLTFDLADQHITVIGLSYKTEVHREFFCNPDHVILMQSTGLMDKNKVHIYPGDFLRSERDPITVSSHMNIKHPPTYVETGITEFEDGFKTRQGIIKTGYDFALVESSNCISIPGALSFACVTYPRIPNILNNTYQQSDIWHKSNVEIIGNIFENPELLEQENTGEKDDE